MRGRRFCHRTLAPRLGEARGTAGRLLECLNHHAGVRLDQIAKLLRAKFGMAEAVHRARFVYSRVAASPIIDELTERCGFVSEA